MSPLLSSNSISTSNKTHYSDATTTTTTTTTTDVTSTIHHTTGHTFPLMEYIPLEIRMEIYFMVSPIKETKMFLDSDDRHFISRKNVHANLWKPPITIAAIMNDTEMMLHVLLPPITQPLFLYHAARTLVKYGRWTVVLQWYCQEYGIPLQEDLCHCAAALGGHLKLLQWLHKKGCEWNARTCSYAAYHGHLDVFQYAHENGCDWDTRTCEYAAINGHFELLQYAHEQGCPWDEWTCSSAAKSGHLEILRYAHEHECPWDARTCEYAACNGNWDILQYAHEHGCPWNEKTCEYAATYGHFKVLKYAHANFCPWDSGTIYAAMENDGHEDILQWAREHGCPEEEESKEEEEDDEED